MKLKGQKSRQMKIRTITIGSNIDNPQDIIPLINKARLSQNFFQEKGYEVQTIRIATNNQTDESAIDEIENICQQEKFSILSIGKISPKLINKIPEILVRNKSLFCSQDLKNPDGIKNTAEIIVELAKLNAIDNLRFAGIINVSPDTPFFPAAFHDSSDVTFSIGLQAVQEIIDATKNSDNTDDMKKKLLDILNGVYQKIEKLAEDLEKEIDLSYVGLDTSAAPMGEESIAYAIENISKVKFGQDGTRDACKLITGVLKSIDVKKIGYCGLMLPPLEDCGLGKRNDEGLYNIDNLLEYSAVCGTGLDTVPIPGDVTVKQLTYALQKVVDLSEKLRKPLSARFFPIPGKTAGEITNFNSPFLFNTKVMEIG